MQLAGAPILVRLVARRERVRLPIWLLSITLLVYAQAASIDGLYTDPADLAAAGRLVEGNAAFIAMAGPPLALDTLGGRVTFEISAFGMILAALMNIFLVSRHLRTEEETERAELVRAGAVGRHAPAAAVLLVAAAADTVLAALVAASMAPFPVPAAGAWALGIGIGGAGLVFAGVAAATSQITTTGRAASGIAGAVLAVSFALRAAGDIGNGALSWLSPLGWAQALRPFAGERWWVTALLVGGFAVAAAGAMAITSRRDLGAGLVQPRPGLPRASAALRTPIGLALRLHRGALLWWALALFLGGLTYGSISGDVEDFVGDNEVMTDLIAPGGGDLFDGFLATAALILAFVAAGFTVQATLKLAGEEQAGRAQAVLAGTVSRWRWTAAHLMVVAGGTLLVLLASGLGTGLSVALVAGDASDVPRMIGASLVYAPALLVVSALAVALYGMLPRLAPLVWAALVLCFVAGYLGELLSLPESVREASPFEHVPHLPAVPMEVLPLVVLLAIAGGLVALGDAGLRRRDLAS